MFFFVLSFFFVQLAMPGMKRDCGGAAAILGAFYAAVKLVSSTHYVSRVLGIYVSMCSGSISTKFQYLFSLVPKRF